MQRSVALVSVLGLLLPVLMLAFGAIGQYREGKNSVDSFSDCLNRSRTSLEMSYCR